MREGSLLTSDGEFPKTRPNLVRLVESLAKTYGQHKYVLHRTGLLLSAGSFSRSAFWRQLVMGILSSQTRWDRVSSYLASEPRALDLELMPPGFPSLAAEFRAMSIRFPNTKAERVLAARSLLDDKGWSEVERDAEMLRGLNTSEWRATVVGERVVAKRLADRFAGISHKQARNVWINLGLLRYEFPLDSRWMGFLRTNDWGIADGSLQRLSYYLEVEDRVQAVSVAADVLPAILDAIVFAHMEKAES